jgi:hypothetical protein
MFSSSRYKLKYGKTDVGFTHLMPFIAIPLKEQLLFFKI